MRFQIGSVEEYLERGPRFVFLYHPALGPLWDVIAQKVRGGALLDRSELVLEVAEASLINVVVEGSLLVTAERVMGHMDDGSGDDHGWGGVGSRWVVADWFCSCLLAFMLTVSAAGWSGQLVLFARFHFDGAGCCPR